MSITWINPAEQDNCADDPGWKIEVTASTDEWGNHCRMWVAKKETQYAGVPYIELRVHSGTDGVSIRTKSGNNGHCPLTPSVAKALVEELKNAHSYSRKLGRKWRDFWRRRNSDGDKPNY